jgi:hypothetical protein
VTPPAWALLALFVGWGFAGGLAFRLGRLRKMGRWYGVAAMPALVRTMPLQLIPLATWLTFLGIAAALATTEEEPASPWGLGFFIASFVAMGWWLVTMVRPARFLKPDWLRTQEQGQDDRSQAGPRRQKVWENIGFAAGGFAVAIFLLWAGAIGAGSAQGHVVTLLTALALGAVCALAFMTSAWRRRG